MDGVILTPLKKITHLKGDILHAMKKSEKEFSGFGEAYFSSVYKGKIKGWKKHNKMTLNIIVVKGEIEIRKITVSLFVPLRILIQWEYTQVTQ